MEIYASSKSARDCENALVQLLNYDKFELIKVLTKSKDTIYWCTLLARAGDHASERAEIEEEMVRRGLDSILRALKVVKAREEIAAAESDAMELDQKPKREETMADKIAARHPKKTIDLDSLVFSQGAHLMTNKKCTLPEGSFKTTKKGYEEVTIPAPKAKPFSADEKLVPITDMPDWSQRAFKGAKTLNRVQSKVYPVAFGSDENLLLCAPTGKICSSIFHFICAKKQLFQVLVKRTLPC
jgi:pre-mRNA-splicing helicase BRR2